MRSRAKSPAKLTTSTPTDGGAFILQSLPSLFSRDRRHLFGRNYRSSWLKRAEESEQGICGQRIKFFQSAGHNFAMGALANLQLVPNFCRSWTIAAFPIAAVRREIGPIFSMRPAKSFVTKTATVDDIA
jgi:hypothetical protein